MGPMPVAATSGVQFIWKGSSTYEDSELDKRYSAGTWGRSVQHCSPGQWPLRVSWIGAQVPGRSILGADQRERPGPMGPWTTTVENKVVAKVAEWQPWTPLPTPPVAKIGAPGKSQSRRNPGPLASPGSGVPHWAAAPGRAPW